ncbi:hypothetical protein Tco_1056730 [Tanacetum coccineum]|uniref:Uncharacterized protein n=1 Tax=Tanacetum coccineum TaxID=301880 RepID=A0ABQ5H5K6_9ASTR
MRNQMTLEKKRQNQKAAEKQEHEMIKTKVIKIVQEEAEKIRIDPKKVISAKAGEKFKMLRMLKCKRNFDVHKPFKLSDFGLTELDKLGPIIQKKNKTIVKDLMTSLGKRYKRLKKISEELRIQSALPALIPKQDQSQSSGRKRKHIELEHDIKVPGLEFNRSPPEGVPFVNNMVIEEAFQRWNDIHKVEMDSLVSYLVMASMIKSLENVRFCLKLKKLIVEHPVTLAIFSFSHLNLYQAYTYSHAGAWSRI